MWYTEKQIESGMGRIIGEATKVMESMSRRAERRSDRYQTCSTSETMGNDMDLAGMYDRDGKLTWI